MSRFALGLALGAALAAPTAALCAADGYCWSTTWDGQCVGEVATYCAQGC